MSDEYTPTTDYVRGSYVRWSGADDTCAEGPLEREFNRWLTAHDAEVRTAALEEAAGIAEKMIDPQDAGKYAGLIAAARIRRTAKDGAQ